MTDTTYFDKVQTKGRPKFVLNDRGKKMIEDLATILCTDEEIASVMGTNIEILQNDANYDTFMELKKRGRDKGKSSLRRKQFEVAMKGNATMLIWLGRNYLNQTDNIGDDTDDVTKALDKVTMAIEKVRQSDE